MWTECCCGFHVALPTCCFDLLGYVVLNILVNQHDLKKPTRMLSMQLPPNEQQIRTTTPAVMTRRLAGMVRRYFSCLLLRDLRGSVFPPSGWVSSVAFCSRALNLSENIRSCTSVSSEPQWNVSLDSMRRHRFTNSPPHTGSMEAKAISTYGREPNIQIASATKAPKMEGKIRSLV